MQVFKCKEPDCQKCGFSDEDFDFIISELRSGRLVVYPTDTLYGLGADPFDEMAVKRVFIAKKRPFDMPLTIAVSNVRMMAEIANLDDRARKLAEAFLPGPLTLLLHKKSIIPDIVTSSSSEVGIRIPDHPIALRIIEEFGPIIATSANLHSHPNPYDAQIALRDLGDSVSAYIDCGPTKYGKPSTIVQLMDGEVEVIRPGAIPIEKIEAVLHG
ncbi:MAG: threonylcarbamoyl-AMP synthase [Methanomassiliicoccales archaeon]|nr:MAG: threonylcarbamoyl-AMP synthase [Methanomassiliicoccales archaeon]